LFDIGWSEMAIIMVLALIIIGPKDLPRVARSIGQWVRKGRMLAREFQSSLEDMAKEAELDDVKKEIEKVGKTDLKKAVESSIDPKGELKSAFDASTGTTGEETVGKVLNGSAAKKTEAGAATKQSAKTLSPPATSQAEPEAKAAAKSAAKTKKPASAKKPASRTPRKTTTAKAGTTAEKPAAKKPPARKRATKTATSSTSGSDASSPNKTGGSSAMAAKSS
jgi:sec-independent protein translocase protein TatB